MIAEKKEFVTTDQLSESLTEQADDNHWTCHIDSQEEYSSRKTGWQINRLI
jgi:hypothetical protein